MRGSKLLLPACSLFCLLGPTPVAGATLPLVRVRLYETGVGYFERAGVLPAGEVKLPVPAGHLDDALKTLVVLGGGVKLSGVAFSSSVSREMARKLAGLPDDGDKQLGFSELSRSFKGKRIELTTARGSVSGRLIDVLDPGEDELERCSRTPGSADTASSDDEARTGCALLQRSNLLILTTSGAFERVASADVISLRPGEPAARARLDTALDALSERGAQNQRDLGILASSGGKVTLGYVAEAPVWRATYRIVLGKDAAKLQGWALLHNDTDEDWQSVQVDLVNGRPTSFLYPLAAPRYARRELVTPAEQLSSVPQLFDTTVDNLWEGDEETTGEGIGLGGTGQGYGYGAGGVGLVGGGTSGASAVGASEELTIGNLAALTPAEGVEAAALFRYTLPRKLALRAHGSALVPFVDTPIKARPIAWFSSDADAAASALFISNDTKQTLPGGTLSVFADGGFAGEALLPRTKPNQSHLVAYGVDLDVELQRDKGEPSEEPRLFAFADDRLEEHYVRRHRESIALKNRSQTARTVYVELAVVDNASVKGASELAHDTESDKTYVVEQLPATQERAESFDVEEGLVRRYDFSKLDSRQLRRLSATRSLKTNQRAALSRAAEQLLLAEIRRGARPKREAELAQALADVERVREDVKILGSVRAKQADAMAASVLELETRIARLRTRIAELASEADSFSAAAKRELGKL